MSVCAYNKSVEIRFSRHAKNKARLYRLTQREVESVILLGDRLKKEDKWESRVGKLRVIWIVVGSYVLVVTIINSE